MSLFIDLRDQCSTPIEAVNAVFKTYQWIGCRASFLKMVGVLRITLLGLPRHANCTPQTSTLKVI